MSLGKSSLMERRTQIYIMRSFYAMYKKIPEVLTYSNLPNVTKMCIYIFIECLACAKRLSESLAYKLVYGKGTAPFIQNWNFCLLMTKRK